MVDSPARSDPLRVRFGEFELDEANALLIHKESGVALAPTPFKVLCTLVRHAGSLLTKHALLDEVWGHRFVSDSVLKGTISDIRTVLGDDARNPRFIETVARRGYRFIAVPMVAQAGDSSPRARAPATAHRSQLGHSRNSSSAGPPRGKAFIGRDSTVERLQRTWERAAAGARAIVWIAGEPGIGKSSLVEHFVSSLGADACVRGQCVQQYGSGEPYHAVLEAVAELCRRDADVAALLRAVAPTWLLQLPWISTADEREALRRELAGANPERMLREMGEFLDRYTRDRPLLLVTEDLHWSDRPTLKLIDFLARRRTNACFMWVSTLRLTEVIATDHPLNTLRRELLLHGLCEEIVLDSFSEAEIAAYLTERWPGIAADENIVRAVHERTEGVPLFIASMVNDVAARSSASGATMAELLVSSPIPENLRAIIEHYASQLLDEQRSMLSAAAVCGAEFRVALLSQVLERDAVGVAEECARLLRGRLWLAAPRASSHVDEHDERYAFRHALFRQALYDRIGSSARADLHRKVGTALERRRGSDLAISATQLATHFDLGRSPIDALRYYAEAAETALTQLSPAECLSLTEHALSLVGRCPANAERTSLEITLGTLRGMAAFHVLGAGEEARRACMQARSLLTAVPLHPMRGVLIYGLGQLLTLRAEYVEALATADLGDSLAGETRDPLLEIAIATTRGWAYMLLGRPRDARESLERALPALESVDAAAAHRLIADPRPALLTLLSIQLTHLGLVDEARERLDQAYALVNRLAQPVSSLVTIWCDALVQVRLGDIERVAALATEMARLVEKYALAQGRTACRWFHALADARGGKSVDSFKQIRAAYEENTALGMIAGGSEVLGYAAEALLLRGDLGGAEEQLAQALKIVEHYGERIYLPQLLLTKAAIAHGRGELAAADTAIRGALEESRSQGASWLELLALTDLCERSTATVDDRRALRALLDQLREGADTPGYVRACAVVDGAH